MMEKVAVMGQGRKHGSCLLLGTRPRRVEEKLLLADTCSLCDRLHFGNFESG